MYVRELGSSGAGCTLLWVHGLGESGLCFESVAAHPALAPFRQLIPDLPGYGRSPWLEQPQSLSQAADELGRWLEGRAERPVVAAGHSMGGILVLLLAEQWPRLVRAVVDIDGNKSAGDCVFSGKAAAQSRTAFSRGGFQELRDAVYRDGLEDEAHRGYYASLRLADPRTFHLHSEELVSLARDEKLAARLAALEAPAHYIAGSPGGAVSRSLTLLDQAGVPVTRIAPSGHWPFIDRRDEFAWKLRDILAPWAGR
jgi:pimeloyl-ACP methyl ester carboxylesterase